jgi:cell fate (sporulation/competence/biofilm development) regulator YlbF (YheA/YmcA/DUF963 family)
MGDTAFSKLAKTISICHRTPQADRVKPLFYASAVLMMNFPRGQPSGCCFSAGIVVYCSADASSGRDARVREYELRLIMQTAIEEAPLVQKTKELCQTILDLPKMKSARQRMDAFMQNESARTQYNNLVAKGQALQEKQQQGLQLTKEEIAEFERERDALMNNPVARDFIDSQGEIHENNH